MTEPNERPQDTKEFLARWNAATEGVLTDRLTEILARLTEREAQTVAGRSTLLETLAPHLLRALQVAATPGSTVHDAIDYLAALPDGSDAEGVERA